MLSPRGFLLFGQHHNRKPKQQQPQPQSPPPPPPQQQSFSQNQRKGQYEQRQQRPGTTDLRPNNSGLAAYRHSDSSRASRKDERDRCADLDSSSSSSSSSDSRVTAATTSASRAEIATADTRNTRPPSYIAIPSSLADPMTARSRSRPRAGAAVVSAPPLASPSLKPSSGPPETHASPVSIPATKQQRDEKKRYVRHGHHTQHARRGGAHNPEAIPPSVAALLAVTNIPRSRSQRSLGQASARQRPSKDERMTVDDIIQRAQRTEKEMSLSLAGDPMGVLLGTSEKELDSDPVASFAPDFDDDASSVAGSTHSTNLSNHTVSVESFLSLDDSFDSRLTSPGTPATPISPFSPSTRSGSGRRRSSLGPLRRRLEPVSSPPGSTTADDDHPLAAKRPVAVAPVEELDFRVFGSSPPAALEWRGFDMGLPLQPLKSAFKSNLTASLRALRNAARSISTLGQASIPPEDFLTRSILTIDPKVPFTDERRPPQLDEEPSAALRRYLNPTTSARMESRPASAPAPMRSAFTASIQMQTYKVRRSRAGTSPAPPTVGMPNPSPQLGQPQSSWSTETGAAGPETNSSALADSSPSGATAPSATPLAIPGRQREMRENSDFIRIAVMEMAMRKRGKLDDQRPGRARWALPARRTSTTPYQIGPDGVPIRWVAIAAV